MANTVGKNKKPSPFGQKITELRQNAKLTMTALADKVGVSEAYISMLESGGRRPSRKVILKLVDVFESGSDPFLKDQLLVLAQHDPLSDAKKPQNSHYEELLSVANPDQFQTFIALVNTLIRQGQFHLAQQRIESGFKHFQDTVQLQMLVAFLELTRRNYEAAIHAMLSAHSFALENPKKTQVPQSEVLLNVGVVHFFKGTSLLGVMHEAQSREAKTEVQKSRKAALAAFQKAHDYYKQGLELEPGHISLLDEWARVSFNLADLSRGKAAKAYWTNSIEAFQAVMRSPDKQKLGSENLLESACFLGHAFTKTGLFEQAYDTLSLISACQPDYAFVYYVLACHCSLHAQSKTALKDAKLTQSMTYLTQAIARASYLRPMAYIEPDLAFLKKERPEEWRTL